MIAAEPSNPWLGGVASLFTVEFFRLARQHLRPGGIMLQWVQGYSLLPEDLQMIVRTFGSAFPEISIWEGAAGDFLLLGRAEPEPIDPRRVAARLEANPAAARDLARIGISGWDGVLTHFMLGEADVRRYADGAPLNIDDRLRLEFSAPRALYLDTFKPNWELMRKFKTAEGPAIAR